MSKSTIGDLIAAHLMTTQMSQNEFAKRARIYPATLTRILAGKTLRPDRDTVIQIGVTMNLNVLKINYLLWDLHHETLGSPVLAFGDVEEWEHELRYA